MPQANAHEATPADLKRQYLISYNAISAALWFGVLAQVLLIAPSQGLESGKVYEGLERYARLTQSLAGLEILHSLVGLVRAPLFTTLMQVSSRLLLVWGIAYNFPQTTKYSPAYSTMLVAWSVTEVVRYSYFVFVLGGKGVPGILTWLRYVDKQMLGIEGGIGANMRVDITPSSFCILWASRAKLGSSTALFRPRASWTRNTDMGCMVFWRRTSRASIPYLRTC